MFSDRSSHRFAPRFLLRVAALASVLISLVLPLGTAAAETPHELIVLLSPSSAAPAPAAVVAAARAGEKLPGGLHLGAPQEARFLVARRSSAEVAAEESLEPYEPSALLQRYVVLSYPAVVDLDALAAALRRNPFVEWVGKNLAVDVSVEPNDPLFDDNPGGTSRPADDHQWGSYALHLPEAWDWAKGHAYVGVVDIGIDADHPDLRPFDSSGNYVGGNFRSHLSWDYAANNATVDDGSTGNNHGTHVSGLVAATTDNATGVAGACWGCSVMMGQFGSQIASIVAAMEGMINQGAQVLNLSAGLRPFEAPDCAIDPLDPFCVVVDLSDRRDTVIAAAAGNDATNQPDYPATDPRVIGVGGLEQDGSFWNDCASYSRECASNSGSDLLMAPAQRVLSTFYFGLPYAADIGCTDNADGAVDGYGPCSGTSMSAPHIAGAVGVLRSINPLLSKQVVRSLLVDNVEKPLAWDNSLGLGKPNVAAAAHDALGRVGGRVLVNRLTPLFGLYGWDAQDHMYTTFPQVASAKIRTESDYRPVGTDVPGYHYLPDGNCMFVPCPAAADVYIFTTDRSPTGAPLVPLYRMSYVPPDPNPSTPENEDLNRDYTYTTEAAGIELFASVGYRFDGIEGYIHPRCSPEPGCIPPGATRLYRLYHSGRDDYAIFPESKLAAYQNDGYTQSGGLNSWIGYVYENVDADGDAVIDGFEGLLGTHPAVADTDGDGANDGNEILQFPYSDPLSGAGQTVGEFGMVQNLTHAPQQVLLSRAYVNPVVIAQPASFGGGQTAVIRITSVQSDRFTLYVQEPPNLDGAHTFENVSWLVLEAGSWVLENGELLQAGKLATSQTVGRVYGGGFQTVTFPTAFDASPVVLSQVQSNDDPSFVKTRPLRPSTTSFGVALEEEEASATAHGTETIGWVALTPGTGTWSGHAYQAADTGAVVTSDFSVVVFPKPFASVPKLLAALASRDGGDNAGLRYTALGTESVQLKVEEDTTYDTEVAHIAESVHYLAIEGSGTLQAAPRP